mmetsp:Transcript_13635/g.29241  ORF Transcript_13635/g.29241 Transcript_13635/m.29241 type:complete len:305 (+) Transcript_13635:77-991(+)|eukprot:CAMPEP_0202892286 /NCGR_PEP_ID=MMETSP1392-20130828/2030_1 /ASSEMBLY_ACC=CAM_ASM_000868 /TAXON_ID=225041 /ORGANISM="Chlamydomonas chlamydogama, Strain SAG 11-48b" /LENGTH=304 /DNA_ID=CAMNT_0049576183 /DNA_START=77 /DNA_END=994 /DNA_ORIENTATION=+
MVPFARVLHGVLRRSSATEHLVPTALACAAGVSGHSRHYVTPSLYTSTALELTHGAQNVVQQLRNIERELFVQSHPDGLKRLQFSASSLGSIVVPPHEIEPGLHSIDVHVRAVTGKTAIKWLRRGKRTPACISLPGQQKLNLHMDFRDAEKLVRIFGRNGCTSRVIQLRVVHPTEPGTVLAVIRAKPTEVHCRATNLAVENLSFMYCPRDHIVDVHVPIKLINDDVAPGVKKGGWMHLTKRIVRYRCLGHAIPSFIELDVRGLQLDQEVRVRDLPIPSGTKLAGQDFDAPVVRCIMDTSEEVVK